MGPEVRGQKRKRGPGTQSVAKKQPTVQASSSKINDGKLQLLDLPNEIILHILSQCDPSAFSLALLTCKKLRTLALDSTDLLRRQIRGLPGLDEEIDHCNTSHIPELGRKFSPEGLYRLFRKRAVSHLGNAVSEFADLMCFKPEHRSNTKICLIEPPCTCGCSGCRIATLDSEENIITIYSETKDSLLTQRNMITPEDIARGAGLHTAEIQVLLITFKGSIGSSCSPQIGVLFRYRLPKAERPQAALNGYNEQADGSSGILKLAIFTLNPPLKVHLHPAAVRDISARWGKLMPSSLAITADGNAAMVNNCLPQPAIQIFGPSGEIIHDSLAQFSPRSDFVLYDVYENIGMIKPLADRFLFFPKGWPIPHKTWNFHGSPKEREVKPLPPANDIFFDQPRAIPFTTHHEHELKRIQDGNVETFCVDTILQLGIRSTAHISGATHFTAGTRQPHRVQGIYIIKGSAEQFADAEGCRPVDLDADYPFMEHQPIARLSGLALYNTGNNSIGLIPAISPGSTRIAIANWKRVYLWAIQPDAFFSRNNAIDPSRGKSDFAYTRCCGHSYYPMTDDEGLVVIRAVELPSSGVVHKLCFSGEDTLWGWTDRGLVRWKWGVGSSGKREEKRLEGEVSLRADLEKPRLDQQQIFSFEGDVNFDLGFAVIDGQVNDILENFDFDSFLQTNGGDAGLDFGDFGGFDVA